MQPWFPRRTSCSALAPSLRGRCPASLVLRADSATHGSMAVARRPRFASATHHWMRPPWASRVPLPIRFPACRALRPRQILRRSRHNPRLLVPSRIGTRSASAPYNVTGLNRFTCVAACLSHCLRFAVFVTSHAQDSIPAGWLGLGGEGIAPSGWIRLRLGALNTCGNLPEWMRRDQVRATSLEFRVMPMRSLTVRTSSQPEQLPPRPTLRHHRLHSSHRLCPRKRSWQDGHS